MMKGIEIGLQYCFCTSQMHRSRMWKRTVNQSKLYRAQIVTDVLPPVPDACGDMKYYLTVFEHPDIANRKSSGQVNFLEMLPKCDEVAS